MDGHDDRRYIIPGRTRGRIINPPRDNEQTDRVEYGYPYNQRHQHTSNPTPQPAPILPDGKPAEPISKPTPTITQKQKPPKKPGARQRNIDRLEIIFRNNAKSAAKSLVHLAQKKKEEAARAEYHTAWQNYYQKYYENYYIAALQEQQKRFAAGQAAVMDSRENDGTLEQSEVQERLVDDILDKIHQSAKQIHKKWWFTPALAAFVAVLIFLALQYNSVVMAKIANFISPGSSSSQTIIVGSGNDQPVSNNPRVIIPKINVNAPVIYGLTDLSEQSAQRSLQNGAINYPVQGASAVPGQRGNTVILGHSSADFFAPGNYKFIFVQLNRLRQDDLFYLDYGNTRYAYKVTRIKVINPDQINELNLGNDKPYATLVTCDPPGTVARRLLIIGEQVSPKPINAPSQEENATSTAKTITGKPKTLLESLFGE